MGKKLTLKRQFNIRISIIFVLILVISGILQFIYTFNQLDRNVERETETIAQSIEQGITETNMASNAIEKQIDYKLESVTKRVSDQMPNQLQEITKRDLNDLADQLSLAGIDIFARDENENLSVVKSTSEEEIGFTFAGVNEAGNQALENLMSNQDPTNNPNLTSYVNENIIILYTAQSGSRSDPQFFKYAYYHQPNTNYIISTFIEADEVYQFTNSVGPDSWIDKMLKEHEYAEEIAVLDPRVFKDPSLAKELYPPLEKVVHGHYELDINEQTVISMIEDPKKVTKLENTDQGKYYKLFIPTKNDKVIYIAMDYDEMSKSFINYAYLLIAIGVISLIVLFLMTARFFNRIYKNIQKIIYQISHMEKGDFTARSHVQDKGELKSLSESTNQLADQMSHVLSETSNQAVETEKQANLLESEANDSVDKIYMLSMETTTETREHVDEVEELTDQLKRYLQEGGFDEQEVFDKLNRIQTLIRKSSNYTTEMTVTLSDLLESLQTQSESLSDISKKLLKNLEQFTLSSTTNDDDKG
ncbi:hypothetical protein J416_05978 [Gracilibacillus halophilus YIM-C55.5]|uniref:HAMP domain-containing protein n=1 Tax=Gracilibacillus halophilus YIM-C55.5 TaxID=1308866 RepID=N4WWV3_9BACI|nr:methyl-accepting chemotaxis protein [Gracilibacillus halophilus]ENH97536.1 hypothetical protein J416_05978 [Gracilibacillus halophilus YIM-C55.5]